MEGDVRGWGWGGGGGAGFDVIDTCGLSRKSLSAALHVLDGPVLGTASCGAVDVCNIGIIGPSESESAEAAMYAASGSQLPVGVLAVLKSLGLTYVAVVHEDSAHARDAAFDLRTRGRQSGICVDTVIEIKDFVTAGVNQLKDQRGRTKDGTLRVVYFGGIQTFLDVQRNLDQRQVDFTGISWLIVKQPENDTQDYDVTNFKPETILFTISNENVSEVYDFVWQKFENVNQASVANDDPIGKAIANCTGSAQKPLHPPNAHFAPVIDALFVMLNAFQRQFRLHCRDPNALCKDIREEFNFMSEVLKFPVQYADLSTRLGVTVEEFAAADRFVNFSADGDLLLDAQSDIFDVWFIESQSLLNKFR
ncbi:hypothetical protein MAR_012226 [Mya arenaria]|uniref:BEACH domain-containing protein n=1 Tax=Mya arenaria TaxID=6604 RepID=A0ABY7FXZ4_MYAAR|nr:hypothetical protein MAR_012226 [Mya arenaria]